jgi:transposase
MPEGATLLGDKGYDGNAIREAAAAKNAWADIPSRYNHNQRFAFSNYVQRQRNLVGRLFNRIRHL